jgi:hypothetical protein
MKKQFFLAALFVLAVSGLQAAESGEDADRSIGAHVMDAVRTQIPQFKSVMNWNDRASFVDNLGAAGPFHWGQSCADGCQSHVSTRTQAIAFKAIVAYLVVTAVVKKTKKALKKKKHKKHHSHS